jgi:hypothetical protein
MKNNTQKTLMSFVFLLAMIFSLNLVLGANEPNVVSPADNANFTSTLFNCTYVNVTGGVTDPVSANSSFYQNGVAIPCTLTFTSTTMYCTPTADQLTDGLLQSISCKIGNATATAWSLDNATSVGIYTSTPTCSFSTDVDMVNYQDGIGIATTQSSTKDALYSLTYAWSLYRSDDTVSTTKTTSAPTFVEGDFDQVGDFKLGLIVTDTIGNTNACTNKTIIVQGSGSSSPSVTTTIGGNIAGSKTTATLSVLMGLLVIIILAVVGYLIIGAKK